MDASMLRREEKHMVIRVNYGDCGEKVVMRAVAFAYVIKSQFRVGEK